MTTHASTESEMKPIDESTNSPQLDAELAHLRQEMRALEAPVHLEAELAKRFARQHRSGGLWGRAGQWFAPGAAVALSLSVSAWLFFAPTAALVSQPTTDAASAFNQGAFNTSPFIALQSLEQIALEPNPRIVETQVPKMMLAGLGIAVAPESANESLRAEMLVSASGQPLALRLSSADVPR